MIAVRDALSSVEIGQPSSFRNLTVVPLLTPAARAADYLTFSQARARGTATITEVSEQGSVPQLRVVNTGATRVLLVDGEELVGAKQNRIVNLSILVPAAATLDIPVSCVEAGRWSARSREFADSSRTMFAQARARKLADVSASLAESRGRFTDQGAVWADIGRKAAAMDVRSTTGAMGDVFERHAAAVDGYAAALAPVAGQVGAVFAIDGRVVGLELFDAPATLASYLPKLVRSWALDALERPGAAVDVEQAAVRRAIDELLAADGRSYPAVGVGEDVRLRGARVQGAALAADGRLVHLTAFWEGGDDEGGPPRAEGRNRELLRRLMADGSTAARSGRWLEEPPPPLPADGTWDRVEGMLLGLAIGDALGNTSEGMRPADRAARYGEIRDYLPNPHAGGARVGLPSDDTQLAFWTLEHLLDEGCLVPERLGRRFAGRRIFGIGRTVRAFLAASRDPDLPWHRAAQRSAGNGALMRIAPVVVPHVRRPSPALWADAALAGMVTHNDPASIGACVGFVRALWEALAMRAVPPVGWWTETVCAAMREIEGMSRYESRAPRLPYAGPMWRFVRDQVWRARGEGLSVRAACDRWSSGAYLLETLPSVLYVLERHASDPEEAIVRAVNDTWDNDTIAAIVGAAVGALHGRDGLPRRWLGGLLGRTRESDDGQVFACIERARTRW